MNERTISLESKRDKLINNCNNTPISIHDTVDHKTTHKDKETPVFLSIPLSIRLLPHLL